MDGAWLRPLRYGWLWVAVGLVQVAAVIAGSLASPPQGPDVAYFDKLLHMGAYGVLGAWFGAVYLPRRAPVIGLALAVLGLSIEFVQAQLGYRSGDWADMAANLAGLTAGLMLAVTPLGDTLVRIETLINGDGR